jgi:POT family proton-dependent oligopeptide transporter
MTPLTWDSVPAVPQIIAKPDASLGLFFVSIITLAFAAGFIKPSLGPLLCDQSPVKKPTLKVIQSKNGASETVIVDPGVTVSRWLLVFYWCINVGAFFASTFPISLDNLMTPANLV